jgi:lipopolysaccharide transport system ATP-binding protein
MICGTLNPSGGNLRTQGRIAALLELGSGFNPEFTGRENVYMNGAILGLTHEEMAQRFEAIESFADIGSFIDQPVKTYSSGMMVRLAFAVIAHVDADILIIDEALAVGDAIFTQKCMRFLRGFMEKGTVLFVSHDTSSVSNLCDQALWLFDGKLRKNGEANDVINEYTEYCQQEIYGQAVHLRPIEPVTKDRIVQKKKIDSEIQINYYESIAHSDGWSTGAAEIVSVGITRHDGAPLMTIVGGESVVLTIEARIYKTLESPILGFFVKDRLGQSLFGEHTYTYSQPMQVVNPGQSLTASFTFEMPMLPNGNYSMTASIADGDSHVNIQHHWLHDALILTVNSPRLRYGLVGIQFQAVNLKVN